MRSAAEGARRARAGAARQRPSQPPCSPGRQRVRSWLLGRPPCGWCCRSRSWLPGLRGYSWRKPARGEPRNRARCSRDLPIEAYLMRLPNWLKRPPRSSDGRAARRPGAVRGGRSGAHSALPGLPRSRRSLPAASRRPLDAGSRRSLPALSRARAAHKPAQAASSPLPAQRICRKSSQEQEPPDLAEPAPTSR